MKYSALSAALLSLTGVQGLAVPAPQQAQQVERRDDPTDYLRQFSPKDVIPTDRTVKIETEVRPTGTAQIPASLSGVKPHTTGVSFTEVSTKSAPLLTSSIPEPTRILKPVPSPTLKSDVKKPKESKASKDKRQGGDVFSSPIGTDAPPSQIPQRDDHPVERLGLTKDGPLQTNKFYSSFFLGNQTDPIYTFPYTMTWTRGGGAAQSYGIAISHTDEGSRVYGDVEFNGASAYYLSPVGIHPMVLSAEELGDGTVLEMDSITAFSARALLKSSAGSEATIAFPLVQGMPYITGEFNGATPLIQSGVYFREMVKVDTAPKADVVKYNFLLEDGSTWHVYAHSTGGSPLELELVNNGLAKATGGFTGSVQIVKNAGEGSEASFDNGAGIYPTSNAVSGSGNSYSLTFATAGHSEGSLYMYALPHHVESFDGATSGKAQDVKLLTTVKGLATLVEGNTWTMEEASLPGDMGFAAWDGEAKTTLSEAAKAAILPIAEREVSQNMDEQSNVGSMYFGGKGLLKFAQIVYTINDLLGDSGLAQAGLENLKTAFGRYASNTQTFPVNYESAWGGIVSSATYTSGDALADFGNTYYNDHHFHYGYHILAAAYIGHLDPAWAQENKDYVNMFVRDIANPSKDDTWFPQWRNFDWYHGHSWAHGLFPAADGKNQESSSEDVMATYGMKMWGTVIGDDALVARADLMLAVQARALRSYYLYEDDNTVQPSQFIGNKVAGILFENKIHHTTFFSAAIECIQGINVIPIHAPTGFTRSKNFISEEWDAFFAGSIDGIDNAWKGIMYAGYALVDPQASYNFFASDTFNEAWIDGGASRTWYMAYAAGKF